MLELEARSRPRVRALAGAALFFLVLLLAWRWGDRWYQAQLLSEQRAEAAVEVTLRGNVVSSILNRRFARLQGLSGFVQAHLEAESDHLFHREFRTFTGILYEEARGVRAVTVAPDGVVQYVYPQAGNASVLGYSPLEDPRPEVREDAERAVRTGNAVVSGPRQLVQGGFGLSVWRGLYDDGDFWGFVGVTLEVQALLAEAGLDQSPGDLSYALRDDAGRVFFGDPELFQRDPVVNVIELPEGAWELAGVPRAGWAATLEPTLFIYRAATLFVVFLLTGLAYLSINRQARLQQAVTERTREIARANALLEERVSERTRELETLFELSHNVTSTLELRPLLRLILQHLRVVVDYTAAGLYLYEKEDGEPVLHLLHSHGPLDEAHIRALWPSQRWPLADAPHQREVIERRAPVLIPDVRANTELAHAFRQSAAYFGDHIARAATWMGVPLLAQDRVIGLLAFDYDEPGYYDERDAKLALAFAGYAAIAIENAQLYEQARSLAILQERQRLARELHDSVSQALYGISLGTLTARRLWERDRPDDAQEALAYAHSLAETALTEMRSLIFELRPESLEQEGLVAALEKQAAALRTRDGIVVDANLCTEPEASLPVKETLYRVSQEALNNVAKHARADRVTLSLTQNGGRLTLAVRDDGRGFDPRQPFPGHLGLRSMRERVEQVGGQFTLESTPGRGTEIRAEVPLAEEGQS